jgi:DNA polymerase-3 subunit epsilon
MPTGRVYHQYINPERDVPEDAVKVHGLTTEFLKNYPKLSEVAQEFIDFVGDDGILVAHNASFDINFINYEFKHKGFKTYSWDRVVDTLEIARSKFPGARNNLDALCRRFNIDNSARTKHGALLDAELLAEVYLELLGGAEPTMELAHFEKSGSNSVGSSVERKYRPSRNFTVTEEENSAHEDFLKSKISDAVWLKQL